MQTTAVYSCTRILAETFASLPLQVYRYYDIGKEKVYDYSLYPLLHYQPNEEKGVMGCSDRHVDESTLEKAFVIAWNAVVENKMDSREKWKEEAKSEDLLLAYRAQPIERMEIDSMLRVLNYIKMYGSEMVVVFLEGTEIECGLNSKVYCKKRKV